MQRSQTNIHGAFFIAHSENESFLNQSFSGGSSLLKSARQRSASLHTNQLAATSGLRRTFLTMSGRGRPSSASKSRSRSGSMSSEHQEMINKVEATFATVKNQLVSTVDVCDFHKLLACT